MRPPDYSLTETAIVHSSGDWIFIERVESCHRHYSCLYAPSTISSSKTGILPRESTARALPHCRMLLSIPCRCLADPTHLPLRHSKVPTTSAHPHTSHSARTPPAVTFAPMRVVHGPFACLFALSLTRIGSFAIFGRILGTLPIFGGLIFTLY